MEQRVIKFRAYSKNLKVPGSNEFMEYSDKMGGLKKFFDSYPKSGRVLNGGAERFIMQYSGLKDKNGKEIYESDLLRYPGDDTHFTAYEVFFHDGDENSDYNIGFSIDRTHHQGSICGGIIPSFKPKSVIQMEVCGNIYEHKHLVKDTQR